VQIEDAGLFLDADGELCARTVTRIEPPGELLAAVDGPVASDVLRDLDRWPDERGLPFPWLVPGSLEPARRRAEAGGPWVRVVQGRLALDVPLSPHGAARAHEQVATRADDPPLAPWSCCQVASLTSTEEGGAGWGRRTTRRSASPTRPRSSGRAPSGS
jgi:hypothetical protein